MIPAIVGHKSDYGMIYQNYGKSESLFNLMSRTYLEFFMYEPPLKGQVPPVESSALEPYFVQFLSESLDCGTVRELLELTPLRMAAVIAEHFAKNNTVGVLKTALTKIFRGDGLDPVTFERIILRAISVRAFQWAKYYRGPYGKQIGNVQECMFKSPLREADMTALESTYQAILNTRRRM